jgi:hypothetical protein
MALRRACSLSLVSPQVPLPDVEADSGMGQLKGTQNAQPDTHTKSYREHAPRALTRPGLGLFDNPMHL